MQGFIGFSASSQPNVGADVLKAFERVRKKDPATRVKALAELARLLEQRGGAEDADALLQTFAPLFVETGLDPNWRVRQELHRTWGVLLRSCVVPHNAKALQKRIGRFLFHWLLHWFDPVAEVGVAARASFEGSGIRADKTAALLQHCRAALVVDVRAHITASTQSVSEGRALSSKEAADVRDNVVSATLLVLQYLLQTLGVGDDLVELVQLAIATHAKSAVPLCKRSLLALLSHVCVTHDLVVRVAGPGLDAVVFGAFDDAEVPGLELLVAYMGHAESWAKLQNPTKALWAKLWAFIRKTCRTIDPVVFGFVLGLVAAAPTEAALGGDALKFAAGLFDAFWDAMELMSVHTQIAQLAGHLADCLLLLLSRYGKQTGQAICSRWLPRLMCDVDTKVAPKLMAKALGQLLARVARDDALASVCWDAAVQTVVARQSSEDVFATMVAELPAPASCAAQRAAMARLVLQCATRCDRLALAASLYRDDPADAACDLWDAVLVSLRDGGGAADMSAAVAPLLVSLAAKDWGARRAALLALCGNDAGLLAEVLAVVSAGGLRAALVGAELDALVLRNERAAIMACRGPAAPTLTAVGLQEAMDRHCVSWPALAAVLARNQHVAPSAQVAAVAFCAGKLEAHESRADGGAFLAECVAAMRVQARGGERVPVVGQRWAQLVDALGVAAVAQHWPLLASPALLPGLGMTGIGDEKCFLVYGGDGSSAAGSGDVGAIIVEAAVCLELLAARPVLLEDGAIVDAAARSLLVAVWCGWLGGGALAVREDSSGFHPRESSVAHESILAACDRWAGALPAFPPRPIVARCERMLRDAAVGPLAAAMLSQTGATTVASLVVAGPTPTPLHAALLQARADTALYEQAVRTGNVRAAAIAVRLAAGSAEPIARGAAWAVAELARMVLDSWAAVDTVDALCAAVLASPLHADALSAADVHTALALLQHRCWAIQACAAQLLQRWSNVCPLEALFPQLAAAAASPELDAWSRLVVWWPLLHNSKAERDSLGSAEFDPFASDVFAMLQGDEAERAISRAPIDPPLDLAALQPHLVGDRARLAGHLWFLAVAQHRVAARAWFHDLRDRSLQQLVTQFSAAHVCPVIVAREMAEIAAAAVPGVLLRCVAGGSAVEASLSKDDLSLQIRLVFPRLYPLVAAEVVPLNNGNFPESLLRRWVLSMTVILQSKGSFLDACKQWASRAVRLLDGIESCVICFCVLNEHKALPQLRCSNCANAFHASCIAQWFNTSHSSKCPMCQLPWAAERAK